MKVYKPLIDRFRKAWIIGIAGSGMSGIAEVLIANGFKVAGSDLVENEVTKRLEDLGAVVHKGHNAKWVNDSNVVIYSSAIRDDNAELVAARERKIPVIARAQMLAELMRMKTSVAVSGSHGKTTITSMSGEILVAGGLEPTVIVGGRVKGIGGGVISGKGDVILAEADEFDQSFLKLSPVIVLISGIDNDHLECYNGYAGLENAFVQFANSVPFYGRTIVCIDEISLHPVMPRFEKNVLTYGFSPQADIRAKDAEFVESTSSFTVEIEGEEKGRIRLPLPGQFNILNALGAMAIGHELGVDFAKSREALERFEGVDRRFEIIGEVNDILVVSDFAHHPTAIERTLKAAKTGWGRRIVAIFQAHLFSRTQMLADQFGRALLGADIAFILPIFPAREDPIEGVSGKLIYDAAHSFGHKSAIYVEDKSEIIKRVCEAVKPGDMVMVLGAGDVGKLAPEIYKGLKKCT